MILTNIHGRRLDSENHIRGAIMFFLKLMSKFLKILRSDASPGQIGWGFALGSIMGLTPFWSFHNLILILLIALLRVNVTSVLLSLALFSFIGWILDPVFHTIGFTFLTGFSFLKPLWTGLYNTSITPFTRFNNTVVMGSLISSLVLLFPNYKLFRWMVQKYRSSWNLIIQKWKIVQVFKGSKLIRTYFKIRNLRG
jgi:uncharacterized protein (TIGR03546 family)